MCRSLDGLPEEGTGLSWGAVCPLVRGSGELSQAGGKKWLLFLCLLSLPRPVPVALTTPVCLQCRMECCDVPAETLYDVLHDIEYRKKWDSNVIETFDIARLTVNADVGYYSCEQAQKEAPAPSASISTSHQVSSKSPSLWSLLCWAARSPAC